MNIGGRPRWPLRDVAAIGCAIRIETRHRPILQGLRGAQGRGSAKSKNQKYQARCQEVLHSLPHPTCPSARAQLERPSNDQIVLWESRARRTRRLHGRGPFPSPRSCPDPSSSRPASVSAMWPPSTCTHPRAAANSTASAVAPSRCSIMRHCIGRPSGAALSGRVARPLWQARLRAFPPNTRACEGAKPPARAEQ